MTETRDDVARKEGVAPVAAVSRSLHLTQSGEVKEAEAEDDVSRGRICRFTSTEELLEDLAD